MALEQLITPVILTSKSLSICELWYLIRLIANYEPSLVKMIKTYLTDRFLYVVYTYEIEHKDNNDRYDSYGNKILMYPIRTITYWCINLFSYKLPYYLKFKIETIKHEGELYKYETTYKLTYTNESELNMHINLHDDINYNLLYKFVLLKDFYTQKQKDFKYTFIKKEEFKFMINGVECVNMNL